MLAAVNFPSTLFDKLELKSAHNGQSCESLEANSALQLSSVYDSLMRAMMQVFSSHSP
jgi:hypothetical protein